MFTNYYHKIILLSPFQSLKVALLFYAFLFALCLTPFYSLCYIIALIVYSRRIALPSAFQSRFARIIVSILILTVIIMVTGVISWFIDASVQPALVLLLFVMSCALLGEPTPKKSALLTKDDIISSCLALVAPLIVIASFYLPHPSHSASVQLMTNGFDNLAHLTLLRTNGIENKYAYGDYEQLKDRVIIRLNSYPQGWHLATAHIINGFGVKAFDQASPLVLIYLYLGSLFAWLFIALYTLGMTSLRLIRTIKGKLSVSDAVMFAAYSLVIQLSVYWGSLGLGFASFIGCLAFLPLLVASLFDYKDKVDYKIFLISILAISGLSQTWILPAIAGLISVAMLLIFKQPRQLNRLIQSLQYQYAIPLLFAAGLVAFQFAIILLFPLRDSTNTLLNEPGGIFGISILLLNILLFGSIYYWGTSRKKPDIFLKLVATCMPLFFIAYVIYFYQIISTGKASYFFTKTALLLFVAASIFLLPAILNLLETLNRTGSNSFVKIIVGCALMIGLVTATGQPVDAINYLLQRNSKLSPVAASQVVNYLESNRQRDTYFALLQDDSLFIEDTDATYFANRFSFNPSICVTNTGDTVRPQTSLSDRIVHLENCTKTQMDRRYLVITSDKSYDSIKNLSLENVELRKITD